MLQRSKLRPFTFVALSFDTAPWCNKLWVHWSINKEITPGLMSLIGRLIGFSYPALSFYLTLLFVCFIPLRVLNSFISCEVDRRYNPCTAQTHWQGWPYTVMILLTLKSGQVRNLTLIVFLTLPWVPAVTLIQHNDGQMEDFIRNIKLRHRAQGLFHIYLTEWSAKQISDEYFVFFRWWFRLLNGSLRSLDE